MHVIEVRNVCHALPRGLEYLRTAGAREDTRAGRALVAPGPVATVYTQPQERVLFSSVRDANPFFHLVESVFLLAGRDDARFLDAYVRDFSSRFAEPDGRLHGSYGARWRRSLGFDQIDAVVAKLRKDHGDRQAVLQMWDAHARHEVTQDSCGVGVSDQGHIYAGSDDLRGSFADRPCNLNVCFRVRRTQLMPTTYSGYATLGSGNLPPPGQQIVERDPPVVCEIHYHPVQLVLDMTVFCRSNDLVWGTTGANSVHFSILQELIAARIGAEVGTYTQVSHNYHVYLSELERLEERAFAHVTHGDGPLALRQSLLDDRYSGERAVCADENWKQTPALVVPSPLVADPDSFDGELDLLMLRLGTMQTSVNIGTLCEDPMTNVVEVKNTLLSETVWRAAVAHRLYRLGHAAEAVEAAGLIAAPDWRTVCTEWLLRRAERRADHAQK